jgi:hypothetical protein
MIGSAIQIKNDTGTAIGMRDSHILNSDFFSKYRYRQRQQAKSGNVFATRHTLIPLNDVGEYTVFNKISKVFACKIMQIRA